MFSAAFIAHVEVAYDDDATKNELATVVPHPDTDIDWLRTTLGNMINSARWRQDEELSAWLVDARLDAFSSIRSPDPASLTPERAATVQSIEQYALAAAGKLQGYLSALPE